MTSFVLAALTAAAFLYLPSLPLLRALAFEWKCALVCSPIVTVAAYSLLATAYAQAGVPCTYSTLLMPVFLVGLGACVAAWALRRKKGGALAPGAIGLCPLAREAFRFQDAALIAVYALVGVCAASYVFAWNLPAPDAVFQAYDNLFHLNTVNGYVETERFSIFGRSMYLTDADKAINPIPPANPSEFYPTAYHMLAAMTAQATGASAPLSMNAVNFVLAGVVFPLSSFALLRQLFWRIPAVVALGSVCSVFLADFPWGFLVFGPLFSNLLSLAVYPLFVFLFVVAFDERLCGRFRVRKVALIVVGAVALAVSQPNSVFLAGVFLVPFCAFRLNAFLARRGGERWSSARRRALAVALALAAVLALWLLVVYVLVLRSSLAQESWPPFATDPQALANLAVLALKVSPAQLVPAALVVLGLLYTLRRREYLWLTFSYAILAFMYFVDAAIGYPVRNYVVGFWYNDGFRVAANLALAAVPLASLGSYALARACASAARRAGIVRAPRFRSAFSMFVAFAVAVAAFYPHFAIPGWLDVKTPFGTIADDVASFYDPDSAGILDSAEASFVEKVKDVVPAGSLVINQPNDGSGFASADGGLFLYYRDGRHYGEANETAESVAIREGLSRYAEDDAVREAVSSIEARYVLLLDAPAYADGSTGHQLFTYDADEWRGVEGVTDDTPGFKTVLSEGDMRLYEIER